VVCKAKVKVSGFYFKKEPCGWGEGNELKWIVVSSELWNCRSSSIPRALGNSL